MRPGSASRARSWAASSSTARVARSICSRRTSTDAACYGECATFWPPLLTHGKPVARPGLKRSLLGTTRRANGGEQVTYAGHPLYRFALDTKPGQTKGEGLNDFGAGWDVLSQAGNKIESDG